jgi:SAM-dependent methyltransferase
VEWPCFLAEAKSSMTWKLKALVMAACGAVPTGDRLYSHIQKRFGNLSVRPYPRLATMVEIAKWLHADGRAVEGATFFEIGTGHIPWVPIALYLCGAKKVLTFDLNRRLEFDLLSRGLQWLLENRSEILQLYGPFSDTELLTHRIDVITKSARDPFAALRLAGIEYRAPVDAARSGLPAGSVDVHYSITTLEHIPRVSIIEILKEARRVLRPTGRALHFIDLSDHFQHQDPSITQINFLRYSNSAWKLIAGNEFAYCNRLRRSDYEEIFLQSGFQLIRRESHVDIASAVAVQNGFPLHPQFSAYPADDLCTTSVRYLAGSV